MRPPNLGPLSVTGLPFTPGSLTPYPPNPGISWHLASSQELLSLLSLSSVLPAMLQAEERRDELRRVLLR
jgi:hypothetical protein